MGRPFALDFGAVMTVGVAQGADPELLADVLPAVEAAILNSIAGDGDVGEG